jgi:hypothetical protein
MSLLQGCGWWKSWRSWKRSKSPDSQAFCRETFSSFSGTYSGVGAGLPLQPGCLPILDASRGADLARLIVKKIAIGAQPLDFPVEWIAKNPCGSPDEDEKGQNLRNLALR